MASPDVSPYVDLTLFDSDQTTAYNTILEAARALLPEWQPRAGQIEAVLAEAFGQRSSEVVNAINRLPGATVETLLQLFGLERSNGESATATVDITLSMGGTIPAGTGLMYYAAVDEVSYIFTLDEDFTLLSAGTDEAAVTAQSVGAFYNGQTTGESLSLLSSSSFFDSAVFTNDANGGADAETDDVYFQRAVSLLASYTSGSTTPSQIQSYVVGNKTYAYRTAVYDRRRYRDRDTTSPLYGTHDGAILVAVGDQTSVAASASIEIPVSASNLADLHESLVERTPSGLTIDVMSAELAEINVTVTVEKLSGYTGSAVLANVDASLKEFLNPNTWDWDNSYVRYNDVVALIDATTGVDRVTDLTLSGNPIIGFENVGSVLISGGTEAAGTIDILGGTSSFAGSAGDSFYWVDENTLTVYTFTADSSYNLDGGGNLSDLDVTATVTGVNSNDTGNGGLIPLTAGALICVECGGTATVDGFAGGSLDASQFSPMTGVEFVETDLILRNLGTLVMAGSLSITVV